MIAWCSAVAILILSVVPREMRPETGAPHNVEHFISYFATGLAFGLGYERKHSLLYLFLILFCASVEFGQIFVPGRHGRLIDFIVDALSASIGVTVASVIPVRR